MAYYRRITPDSVLVKGAVYEGKAGEAEKKAGLILIDDVPWREEDFILWEPMAGDHVIAFATSENSGVGIVSRVIDKSVFVKFKDGCEYEVTMITPFISRAPRKQEVKETAPKEYPVCEHGRDTLTCSECCLRRTVAACDAYKSENDRLKDALKVSQKALIRATDAEMRLTAMLKHDSEAYAKVEFDLQCARKERDEYKALFDATVKKHDTAQKEYPTCIICMTKHDPVEKCAYCSLVERIYTLMSRPAVTGSFKE